jgi:hypothetical protein
MLSALLLLLSLLLSTLLFECLRVVAVSCRTLSQSLWVLLLVGVARHRSRRRANPSANIQIHEDLRCMSAADGRQESRRAS